MQSTILTSTPVAAAVLPRRFDLYAQIHKGLRTFMSATLTDLGMLDGDDNNEVKRVLDQLDDLLDFCISHIDKEDRYVHPAINAHQRGGASPIATEHDEHRQSITRLRAQADKVASTTGPARDAASHILYRSFARFFADNLLHMEDEESGHNAMLWAAYGDAQLAQIHNAIVAASSPADLTLSARWMVPSLTPAERTALLCGVRMAMPAGIFQAMLGVIEPHLRKTEWSRLCIMLDLPQAAGDATTDPHAAVTSAQIRLIERFADAAFVRFCSSDVAALVTPDFTAHPWAALGGARGAAGIEPVVAAFRRAFDDTSVTLQDAFAQGDRVAVRYVYDGRHCGDLFGVAATGKRFHLHGIMIARIEEGRIAEFWREEDMLGLQQQLGVVLLHNE